MKFRMSAILCGCAYLVSSMPANAATLLFMLSGSRNAVFQLESTRVPDTSSTSALIGSQIGYNNVAGIFNGAAGVASSVSFGTNLIATLNVNGVNFPFTQFNGPALFSGPVSAPVFNLGTFNLTSIGSGSSTITISQLTAAVPEPATWAMMLGGFGIVGATLRRRTIKVAFNKAA